MRWTSADALLFSAALAAAVSAAALLIQLGPRSAARVWWGPVVLRISALALALGVLGGLVFKKASQPQGLPLVVLLDRSQSLSDEQRSLKKIIVNIESWAASHGVRLLFYALGSSLEELRRPADFWRLNESKETRIAEALNALAQRRPAGSPVLLLSDGVETQALGAPKTPLAVFPVAMGSVISGDLELSGTRFPPAVFARGEASFELTLRYPAGLRETRLVSVKNQETAETVWQTTVTLSGVSPQDVELTLPVPRQVGPKRWKVEVAPASWEKWASNNAAAIRTEVLREKLRVLYLAGKPSFDYSYLRELVRSRSSRELVSFVILRNPEDVPPYGESELSLIPFPAQEIFSRSLNEFDLFILQDFAFSRFALPLAYLDNILAFVRSGGGLIYLAGPNSQRAQEGQDHFLPEALGVELEKQNPVTGEAVWTVEDRGLWNRLFLLVPDPARNIQIWQEGLASLYTVFPHRHLRAGSQAWLLGPPRQVNSGFSTELARLGVRGESQGRPAVIVNRVGKGRSVWVGFSGSWMWKSAYGAERRGPDFYDAFWEGLLSWASAEDSGHDNLRVYLDKTADGRLKVTAKMEAGPKGELRGEILPGNRPLVLVESVPGSGVYEGFIEEVPNTSELTLRVRHAGQVFQAKAPLGAGGPGGELRASQDETYLQAIASGNNAQMLGAGEEWESGVPEALAHVLLARLKSSSGAEAVSSDQSVLTRWALVLSIALLILEWAWRRFKGLTA